MIVDLGLVFTVWACFIAGVVCYIKGFERRAAAAMGASGVLGIVEGVRSLTLGRSVAILALGAVLGAMLGALAFRVARYARHARERDL